MAEPSPTHQHHNEVVTIPSVTKTMAITSAKHVKTTCHNINPVAITSTPQKETGYNI